MNGVLPYFFCASRRRPLAVCVGSLFALSAPASIVAATIWPVTTCNDAGPGSLRAVLAAGTTISGDTVDLSQLGCSVISLTTGELTILQNALTIKGPGADQLTIDGSQLPSGYTYNNDSRIFTHEGTGALKVRDLSLAHGQSSHSGPTYPALGGCIFSQGTVRLYASNVSHCTASSLTAQAAGGAIYAKATAALYGSTIASSNVFSPEVKGAGGAIYAKGNVGIKYGSVIIGNTLVSGKAAYGGGVRALGSVVVRSSTIIANSVTSSLVTNGDDDTYKYAAGGGISADAGVSVYHSLVSNNTSNGSFAGIDAGAPIANAPTAITLLQNSTISGNQAGKLVGGVYSNNGTVQISNSTIAFNTAGEMRIGLSPFNFLGPGLALVAGLNDIDVNLQSSLLSNNVYGGSSEFDLTTAYDSADPGESNVTFNVGPANNFVRTRLTKLPLPNGTLQFTCPLLGTLRDNGGSSWTHSLLSTSVAIDAGNNVLDDDEDQRGVASNATPLYPRVLNGMADIGAFEVNQDETIFDNEFEGCPDIF